MLAADVVSWSDGGGQVSAARHPVVGAGLREINGEPALVVAAAGQFVVIALEVVDGRIAGVRSILNPDKLRYLRHQLSHSSTLCGPS